MKPIITCNTKAEIEFHGCAANDIAGILFLLSDIRDGHILLQGTRGVDRTAKTATSLGEAYITHVKQAIDILEDMMRVAGDLGACES